MARADFRFVHRLRVRWEETDMQGVVFFGRYTTYYDVGITEHWRAVGLVYPQELHDLGLDLFVKKVTLEYHNAARFDDWVDIGVRVARMGQSSLRYLVEIYRGDELMNSGEVIYVMADPSTRKPAPIPEGLRLKVRGYERVGPQE
jgi:acyl-CoA thioester hydrolase